MKILIAFYYICRSLVLRGALNSLKLWRAEAPNEKKFCIHTASFKKSESPEFFHYQAAGYPVLFRLFKETIKDTTNYSFVDIGCGKGRAVFAAEYCGYNDVTGIEMDKDLLQEALVNLNAYCLKRPESSVHFIHANALQHVYLNRPTVYFFFNPFNEDIMAKVLDKILASTSSDTWFVYMNPLFTAPFIERNCSQVKVFKTRLYTEAKVFRMEKREG